ncbi:MAG: hypothetical protein LBQ54_10165 [Planctomycetaceae bacterium]|nr:hypothetical protein [Planctomycetaceae bacterium]
MPDPEIYDVIASQGFDALVSKGIYAMLFPVTRNETTGDFETDTATNLLNGYPVGGISGSGDTADSEEFQDQLMGGVNKCFISGAIDPGDISFNTYYSLSKGRPKIQSIKHSRVITPQFVLMLAVTTDDEDMLQGWFAAGVNYSGGGEIKGDNGKIIGSSLKFKVTGMVKAGSEEVGLIDKSLYGPLPAYIDFV